MHFAFLFGDELVECLRVTEPDEHSPRPRYRWPWFVLGAALLGIALTVVWVWFAAQREKTERNFDAPLPSQSPQ
jgi:hypothetical protein